MKRDVPSRAADLYTSPMFLGRRRFVEQSCSRWFILSALHRVVARDELLAPYNVTLDAVSAKVRRAWSEQVLLDLEARLGDLGEFDFEIHAGSAYRDFGLVDGLQHRGAGVFVPAAGLGQGEQLAFYANESRSAGSATTPTRGHASASGSTGYSALGDFLRGQTHSSVELTFAAVERIIDRALPAFAREHRAWWANTRSHSHASSWLDAGWRVASVDQRAERVRFHRVAR